MFRFLQRLFQGHPAPAGWQPLHRPAAELRAYEQWVAEQQYLRWLGPYFKAYHYCKAGLPRCHNGLKAQRIEHCGQPGVLLFYDASIGPVNFRHFFDLLRDRVQALGYRLVSSDVRTRRHQGAREAVAKHFLKPTPADCPDTGRCQQRFGTVTIDLLSLNGQPGFIRITSNHIEDSMFCEAYSFDQLMDAVFNIPGKP